MKIVSQVYPVGCPCCGNYTLHAIKTKKDGELKNKPATCPRCRKTVVLLPIGKTETYGEADEFMKVKFTHRMVQKALLTWESEAIKEGESSKQVPLLTNDILNRKPILSMGTFQGVAYKDATH